MEPRSDKEEHAWIERFWKVGLQMLIGLALTTLFLYLLTPVLLAAILAVVLATICYPLYRRLRRRLPRSMAASLVTGLVAFGVLLPVALTLYAMATRIESAVTRVAVPTEAGQVVKHPAVRKALSEIERHSPVPLDPAWLYTRAVSVVRSAIDYAKRVLGDFVASMPRLIIGFLIVLLSLYFLLEDGPGLVAFFLKLSPWDDERARSLFHAFEVSCRGVVVGYVLSGLAQGVLVGLFFTVLSVPSPIFWGAVTVIIGVIPVLGGGGVMFGAAVYLVADGRLIAAIVALAGSFFVSVADNFVRAWTMKGESRMHPLLAILSALGAIEVAGALGVFFGPITAGIFLALASIVSEEMGREKTIVVPPGAALDDD